MASVVPPLYFGHLSYTPPPGFSGHFPNVETVPPGYNYRETLATARKEALYANSRRPEVWRSLSSREHARRSRLHDPNWKGCDAHNPISNDEGIIPGYKGHIPHLKSNGIPGFTYKRLTSNCGLVARTNRDTISMVSEQRQAFADAANQIDRSQQDLPPTAAVGGFPPQDFEEAPPQAQFEEDVVLTPQEMKHANAAWLEFHSKMEEHHAKPSFGYRSLDTGHKGMVTAADVKGRLDALGIWTSDKTYLAILQGLGCDARGNIHVVDYMRACELSLVDAWAARKKVARGSQTAREMTRTAAKKPKFLKPITCRSAEGLDGTTTSFGMEDSMEDSNQPMLLFSPRLDPMVELALQRQQATKPTSPVAKSADTKQPFGVKSIPGYSGHQPTWRSEEFEQLQNQLLLRVKPDMRMQPAKMRSTEDEVDDNSSKELKEARAAWKLILANFEEFKKVQDAFREVDKDFSGVITRDELRRLIENVLYIEMSNPAFDIIFNTMDADHSGELSFEEFASAITNPNIELTEAVSTTAEAKKNLARLSLYKDMDMRTGRAWDTGPAQSHQLFNKNETLTIGDGKWVIQNLRKKIDGRFFEIKRLFAKLDVDGSGSITRDEFVQALRRYNLVPEGGDGAVEALCDALDADRSGQIDYLEFQKAFASVDPRLQMADAKLARKAAVERRLKMQSEECGEEELDDDEEEDEEKLREKFIKAKSRFFDTAMNNPDLSRFWQEEARPGHPTEEVKKDYQRRAQRTGHGMVSGATSPKKAIGSPFPLKSANSTRQPLAGGNDDAPVLFGVKVTNQKGRAQTQDGTEEGRSVSPSSQNVSMEALQAADAVWNLLREYNSSTHGSMQRAFRSVDKDGSGRIEKDELRHLIVMHLSIDATDEDIDMIFSRLDRGGKGNITYSEFVSGLRASLVKQHGHTSALEAEEHPLDPNYGKKLALLQAPVPLRREWDRLVTKATAAGNEIFAKGAASVQYGDRYSWKASMPYSTTAQQIGRVGTAHTPRDPILPAPGGGKLRCSAPTLAQYARQAGVRYVDGVAEAQRWEAATRGSDEGLSQRSSSGAGTPARPRPKPEPFMPAVEVKKQTLQAFGADETRPSSGKRQSVEFAEEPTEVEIESERLQT